MTVDDEKFGAVRRQRKGNHVGRRHMINAAHVSTRERHFGNARLSAGSELEVEAGTVCADQGFLPTVVSELNVVGNLGSGRGAREEICKGRYEDDRSGRDYAYDAMLGFFSLRTNGDNRCA